MLFCTPAPGLSHAGILACCTLTGLGDDEMHDLLGGHVPVETTPEPTYLKLTELEQVRGWLQQAEQRLQEIKARGGSHMELAEAQREANKQGCRVSWAKAAGALGPLFDGRRLEFDYSDFNRYAIVDKDGRRLFHVPHDMKPADVRRTLAIYDNAYAAGVEAGRADVRRPILAALGLLD